jgi:hypothetical protein
MRDSEHSSEPAARCRVCLNAIADADRVAPSVLLSKFVHGGQGRAGRALTRRGAAMTLVVAPGRVLHREKPRFSSLKGWVPLPQPDGCEGLVAVRVDLGACSYPAQGMRALAFWRAPGKRALIRL